MSKNFWAFCRKIFGGAKTPLYVSIRTICRKHFSFDRIENFKYFSDNEPSRFGFSSENFRWCCRDCFQLVHRDNKKENKLFEFLYFFEALSKNFLALFRQTFGGVVKTAFYLSIRTVSGKTYFSRTYVSFNLCGAWAITFRPFFRKVLGGVVKTVFYLFIGKVWRKTLFWRMYVFLFFFYHFGILSKKSLGFFLKKLSQGLSKLHFTSS